MKELIFSFFSLVFFLALSTSPIEEAESQGTRSLPFFPSFSWLSMASLMSHALSSRSAASRGGVGSFRRAASATASAPQAAAAGDSLSSPSLLLLPWTSGRVGRGRSSASVRPVRALASSSSYSARRSRSPSPQSTRHDVVGLGQAMVDFSASVDDAFLEEFGVAKGGRR